MKRLTSFLAALLLAVPAFAGPFAIQGLSGGSQTQLAAMSFGVLPSSATVTNIASLGTGYAPGERITLTGGTATRNAAVIVIGTQAISATVVSGGSGGANGPVTVTATTGTGTKAQFSGTISGGALTGALTLVTAGSYTANPTTPAVEPVTGGGLTGATINLVLGINNWQVVDVGVYSALPSNPVAQGSTSGSGTGATFTLSWGPLAAGIATASLQNGVGGGGGSVFIGGDPAFANEAAGGNNYGNENVFIGDRAGGKATSGNFNVAIGHNAYGIGGATAPSGSSNTIIGTDAARNVTGPASGSTVVGTGAGKALNSGNNNTLIGSNAGIAITNSGTNTIVGQNAGSTLVSGSGANTIIGQGVASTTLATGTGNILIGTSSAVDTAASGTNTTLNIGGLITGDLAAAGAFGYATGHGGTITQLTSRATGVQLDQACGEITLFTAAGSATAASFTVTDAKVAATDIIVPNVKSGTNKYLVFVTAKAAGSFELTFQTTGGTASDAPVFSYCVFKGVAS